MDTIKIEGGKYEVVSDAGQLCALRHGERWRDLTGDKLASAMFTEIAGLRAELAEAKTVRMLTQKELDSIGSQAEGMDGNQWDKWVQRTFAAVNNLTIKEES